MKRPYVISAELDLPSYSEYVNRTAVGDFRETLDSDLQAMGHQTEWVESGELQYGVSRLIGATQVPVVSLDDRYGWPAAGQLGISRGVNVELNDVGYVRRAGYEPIARQFATIACLGREVVLADDVLFSGQMIVDITRKLAAHDVSVSGVICGVAIGEGAEKLAERGIDVQAVRYFPDGVADEICERDFALMPGAGRRIADESTNALYFDPDYGRPNAWASIPPGFEGDFCISSLERSARLLRPGLPARAVGGFLGYDDGGTIQESIAKRRGDLR